MSQEAPASALVLLPTVQRGVPSVLPTSHAHSYPLLLGRQQGPPAPFSCVFLTLENILHSLVCLTLPAELPARLTFIRIIFDCLGGAEGLDDSTLPGPGFPFYLDTERERQYSTAPPPTRLTLVL